MSGEATTGARTMKVPETQAEINDVLHQRRAAGLCVEVVGVDLQVLRDDWMGVFVRVTIKLADGDTFDVDTVECAPLLASVARRQPDVN